MHKIVWYIMLRLNDHARIMGRGSNCCCCSIDALKAFSKVAYNSLVLLLLLLLLMQAILLLLRLVLLLRMLLLCKLLLRKLLLWMLLLYMQPLLLLLLHMLLLHQMLLLLLLLLRTVVGEIAQLEIVTQIAVSGLRGRGAVHNGRIARGQLTIAFRAARTAVRVGREGTHHGRSHIHGRIIVIIIMIVVVVVEAARCRIRILHFR